MLPLVAMIMIASGFTELVTSRSTADLSSMNFKNSQNSLPAVAAMRLNSVINNRADIDQYEKFDPSLLTAAGQLFNDDLSDLKYQNGIIEESESNSEAADEITPLVEVSDPDDNDIDKLSVFLTQLLQEPGGWESPIVLVEEPAAETWDGSNSIDGSSSSSSTSDTMINAPWKRSRYYRRYPWKRQNSKNRYDDASRYLCTPTREDVFQLLVALHDARQGNKSKTVNFCNRRRPAGAVFTNIRFLGRRK